MFTLPPFARYVAAVVACLALPLNSAAQQLDRSLQDAKRLGRSARVIVKARAGHGRVLREQLAARGYRVTADHPGIDAVSVELAPGELDAVCGSTAADGCSDDAVVLPSASLRDLAAALASARSGGVLVETIGAPASWLAGGGVTVALIDSGIHPSPAFSGRIKAFYDFTADGRAVRPYDDYGHGTHVAGLIGARSELPGVAPSVSFVGTSSSSSVRSTNTAAARTTAAGQFTFPRTIGDVPVKSHTREAPSDWTATATTSGCAAARPCNGSCSWRPWPTSRPHP